MNGRPVTPAARRLYHDGSAVSEVLRMSDAATRAQEKRISEIRDRLDRTVPGPWYRVGFQVTKPEVDIVTWAYADLPPADWEDADARVADVLDFIAHSREDVPWLLAELERVTRERDEALEQAALQEAAIVGQMKARERETQLREALPAAIRQALYELEEPMVAGTGIPAEGFTARAEWLVGRVLAGLPSVPPEGQS